jgi:hypothetical protein
MTTELKNGSMDPDLEKYKIDTDLKQWYYQSIIFFFIFFFNAVLINSFLIYRSTL